MGAEKKEIVLLCWMGGQKMAYNTTYLVDGCGEMDEEREEAGGLMGATNPFVIWHTCHSAGASSAQNVNPLCHILSKFVSCCLQSRFRHSFLFW